MAVGEARRREAAAEIDDLRGSADMSTHRRGGASRDEAPILDGKAFDHRGAGVGGEHLAVEDHEIGGLRGGMGCKRNGHRSDETDMQCGPAKAEEPRIHGTHPPRMNASTRAQLVAGLSGSEIRQTATMARPCAGAAPPDSPQNA